VYVADPAAAFSSDSARAAFVAAMQTPAPYAALHEVREPVRLVETHVSWVFLTGSYAYKVKKPVRLPFLDYSTAARREWLCNEELRLNRRHAPELYLETVPICGHPDAPRVGVDGEAFEHTLRMRQFDRDDELSQLLRRAAVTSTDVADLATDLAQMHAQASPAEVAATFGAPDVVHRITRDNFRELGEWLPATIPRTDLDGLQAVLERAYARLAPRMLERRRDGRVREGHGDLHCGNVVRWRGRLVAFDGLEFDPALRFIDVANDLAFLSMDLGAHGRRDLRRALLDRWTEASGDYGAIELLPYYEPARALVRAKVAALQARQAAGADGDASARLAAGYFDWARTHLRRAPPMLVVMVGLSGSGKTWLARRIATAIDALHLRSDVERKRLAGLAPLERSRSEPDAGIYTPAFNERTYARLIDCVNPCLEGGESVVVDAANLRRRERHAFLQAAAAARARVRLVHCTAPTDVLRRRVAERGVEGADASEATVDVLERQPSYWEPLDETERALCEAVDTTQPMQVEAALQRLASAGRR
jgi:aminoglycoside phosphotransferase family enzyme/predicted kinase